MADPLRTISSTRTSRATNPVLRRAEPGAAFGFAPPKAPGRASSPWATGWLAVLVLVGLVLFAGPLEAETPREEATLAAEDAWRAAVAHYRHGRWQLAVVELQELVEKHPRWSGVAQAQFLLGEAQTQLRHYAQAEQAFRRCLQQPGLPDRWRRRCTFRLGELAFFQGKWEPARKLLAQFVQEAKDDPWLAQAHWLLAQLEQQQGRLARAQEHLQRLIEQFPQSPLQDRARVSLAEILLRQGQEEKALRYLEAVADKPRSEAKYRARFLLGRQHFLRGRYEEAAAQFRTLLAQKDLSPGWKNAARLALARSLLAAGRFDPAAELLKDLSKQKPPLGWEARYWTTHLLRKQGKLLEAQRLLVQLARELQQARTTDREARQENRNPSPDRSEPDWGAEPLSISPARCWYEAAVLAHKTDRRHQARAWYQQAAASAGAEEPWAAQAHWGLLRLATAEQDQQAATAAWKKLLAEHKHHADLLRRALWHLGRFLLQQRQYQQTLRLVAQAEKTLGAQLTWRAEALRGLALCGLGRYADSAARLQKLVAKRTSAKAGSSPDRTSREQIPAEIQAELWYTLGVCHLEQGRWSLATEAFARAIELAPLAPVAAQALAAQALAQAHRGQEEASRRLVEQLLAQFPQATEALPWILRLAHRYYETRRWPEAARCYRLALRSPQPEERLAARSGLAWSLWEQGELERALEQFLLVAKGKQVDSALAAEALYMAGLVCHRTGRPQQALRHWQRLVQEFAGSEHAPQALLAAGEVLERLGRPKQALEHYQKLLDQYPKAPQRPAALFNAAWVAWEQNRPRQALELMEQLARRWPDHLLWPQAALQLAYWFHTQGQREKGAAWASRLVRRPECPDRYRAQAAYLLGRIAIEQENWAEVHRWMEAAARMAPEEKNRRQARFWVCEALYRQGHYGRAAEQIEQLLGQLHQKELPWIATLRLRQAQCLLRQKKWRQALRTAQAALEQHPQFPQAYELHYVRGRALMALAEFDQARAAFLRVIHSAGAAGTQRAAAAQWMIGETYFHQRNYREALRHYLRVDVLYPHCQSWQAAALLQAGKCYEKLGQPDKASELYLRIVRLPDDSPYKDQAAQQLRALRNQETAVR